MHVAMIRVASSCKFSVVYSVGEFCSLPFFPFVSNESKFRTFSKMSRMMDTNIQIYIRKSCPKSKTFIIPPYKNRANRIEKKNSPLPLIFRSASFFSRAFCLSWVWAQATLAIVEAKMARLCHRKAVQAPRQTLWQRESKNKTLRDIKTLNGKKYIRFNSKDYLVFYQNLYVGNLLILFIGGVFLFSYSL